MLSPIKIFLFLALSWIIVNSLAPFSFLFSYNFLSLSIIIGTSIAFICGALLSMILPYRQYLIGTDISTNHDDIINYQRSRARAIFWPVWSLSALGVTLRFWDRFITRGFLFTDNVTSTKLALLELGETTSLTAALGAIFFSFVYPLFAICLIDGKLTLRKKLSALPILVYPIYDGFAQGTILGSGAALLFYYFSTKCIDPNFFSSHKKSSFLLTNRISMISIVALSIIVASNIFLDRVLFMYDDPSIYMQSQRYSSYVVYDEFAYRMVDKFGSLAFVPIWIMHYFVSGVHNLFFLIQNFQSSDLLFGQYQLNVPSKFFKILGLASPLDGSQIVALNPLPGRYQTFWGPAFMDFGIFIPIESFIIGFVSGRLYKRAESFELLGILVYPYVQSLIVIGFFVNGLVGERLYFLVGLIAVAIALKFLRPGRRRDARP